VEILIPLAILLGFFWFFVLLPQRRRTATHSQMQDTLDIGDEVITAGGLHGDVVQLDDTIVHVEVAAGTVVRVDRRAIAARVEDDGSDEEDDVEDDVHDSIAEEPAGQSAPPTGGGGG
jgi:preprotein translocase subunit YajC